jgi:DNA-binding GntR family transcriptional regulator
LLSTDTNFLILTDTVYDEEKNKGKELLYLKIAKRIEQQINKEVLKVGDKLPSIRMICRQHVSMSTAQFAYYELEAKSLIESRPQSGYYVSNSFLRMYDCYFLLPYGTHKKRRYLCG